MYCLEAGRPSAVKIPLATPCLFTNLEDIIPTGNRVRSFPPSLLPCRLSEMHGVHTTGILHTDIYFDFFSHSKCNDIPLLIWKIFLRCPTRIFSQCFDLLHWNPVQTVTRFSRSLVRRVFGFILLCPVTLIR
jgi:hypothetical protein